MKILEVKSLQGYSEAAELFKEYATQINVDLSFQNFDQEVNELNKQYSRPNGAIFLIHDNNDMPSGCIGVRKLSDSICELKRMYLRKEFRGKGIGRKLLLKSIEIGKELHYQRMRLDTLPSMEAAIGLYREVGFYEIDAYRFNPIPGAKYFEISLQK